MHWQYLDIVLAINLIVMGDQLSIFGQVPPGILRINHMAHQRQLQGREHVYVAEDQTIFIAVTSWKGRSTGGPLAPIETLIVKNCKATEPKWALLRH